MKTLNCFAALLLAAAPAAAATLQPAGSFVMEAVHRANVRSGILSSPQLAGIHLRDEWALAEPQPGSFNFAWLDGELARAKSFGKQATLGIYAGNNSPAWLHAPMVGGAPLPWDSKTDAAFYAMVAQLGLHYSAERAIAAVHMTSPATDASMEMYLAAGVKNRSDYSDQKIIDVWERSIDAYGSAFPNTALVLDLAMVPDSRGAVTRAVDEYARATLGDRFNAIVCNLKASTNLDAKHIRELERLHSEGVRIGFEMVGPSSDQQRFGGSFTSALALGRQLGGSWFQVYQGDVSKLPSVTRRLLASSTPEPAGWFLFGCGLAFAFLIASRYRRVLVRRRLQRPVPTGERRKETVPDTFSGEELMQEVVRRCFETGLPVFADRNDDGTVTFDTTRELSYTDIGVTAVPDGPLMARKKD